MSFHPSGGRGGSVDQSGWPYDDDEPSGTSDQGSWWQGLLIIAVVIAAIVIYNVLK